MPFALGAAAIGEAIFGAIGAAEIGATAVAGTTVSTIVGSTIIAGAAIGAGQLVQSIEGQKRNIESIVVKQAIAPRRRCYGQCKLGGFILYMEVSHKVFMRAQLHCDGPISQILEYWFDDVKTSLAAGLGGVVPDAVYQGTAFLESHLGSADQPASALMTGFGGSDTWTAAMRLAGIAYTVGRFTPLRHGDQIYPAGAPNVRIVAQTSILYDPRTGGWAYSDNAALALLDYVTHPSGLNIPLAEVNIASFSALADICDQGVGRNDGTVEPRYRSWGAYDFNENRADVLARLCAVCDARLYDDADGLVAVRGGAWSEPTVTITSDMILGWDDWSAGNKTLSACNRIKFTYTAPKNDYQQIEGDPWDDLDSQAQIGVCQVEQALRNCPSHSQGRRLAKILMHRKAPPFRISGLRLNAKGLRVYGEDVVRLTLPEIGIDTTVAVDNQRLAGDALDTLTVDVYGFGPGAYAWNAATEEGNEPSALNVLVRTSIAAPTGIAFTVQRISSDGRVTGLYALFTADAPADPSLTLLGQYRAVGDSDWIAMDDQGATPIAGPLNGGAGYEAELAWSSGTGISAFSAPIDFEAVADPNPPAAPSNLSATVSGGTVSLAWMDGASGIVASAVVYRDGTSVKRIAATVGGSNATTDTPGPGNHTYTVRDANTSGIESADSNAVDVTV